MSDMVIDTPPSDAPPFAVSESAAKRIASILNQDENKGMMLRISVSGGGCSGFQYGFTFDDKRGDTDFVIEREGAKVLIDDVSLDLLKGSEIDYVEDMIGSSFQIKNPQAKSTCGCGNSFAV
jgi:iron-sulfur cluster insertion protein